MPLLEFQASSGRYEWTREGARISHMASKLLCLQHDDVRASATWPPEDGLANGSVSCPANVMQGCQHPKLCVLATAHGTLRVCTTRRLPYAMRMTYVSTHLVLSKLSMYKHMLQSSTHQRRHSFRAYMRCMNACPAGHEHRCMHAGMHAVYA
eukprot:364647-Chlamydomonas_euryale.AAC.4